MSRAGPHEAQVAAGSGGSEDRSGGWWARSGLVARIAVSAIAVAIGLAIVFAVLFLAIVSLRQRSDDARQSQQVIATANGLQTLVIDLETGVRGFALTRDERYLSPWRRARDRYPGAIATLVELTKGNRLQHERALSIKRAVESYFRDYSVPLVGFEGAQRSPEQTRAHHRR